MHVGTANTGRIDLDKRLTMQKGWYLDRFGAQHLVERTQDNRGRFQLGTSFDVFELFVYR